MSEQTCSWPGPYANPQDIEPLYYCDAPTNGGQLCDHHARELEADMAEAAERARPALEAARERIARQWMAENNV